jgi:translation initiation factor IF-2
MGKKNTKQKIALRPPIVTLLGHVDHGKTTLLDFIRKTKVVKKEAGGITQSIGASVVVTKERKKITFIDTPGHAAFADMRSRGAKIADIAILVVAADDGVKPQTREALEYIIATKIPFIVAVTKTDLSTASVENVKKELEQEQIRFEGKGGEVPLVALSAKEGKGIENLLEMITLISEINEITADRKNKLDALVIETTKSKAGPLVNLVVRDGVLHLGDEIIAGGVKAKVKGLFGGKGERMKEVKPGEPAQLLGFSDFPEVGSSMTNVGESTSLDIKKEKPIIKMESKGKYPIIVKTQNAGSLEALISNLPEGVNLVSSGVGDVTESDVFLAKSANTDIYVFEAKASSNVLKLAKTEGVLIHSFNIIYELFEKLEEDMEGEKLQVLGKAEIMQIFPYNRKKVAGCKVIEGVISRQNPLFLSRGEKKLGRVRIVTMKREKDTIKDAKQGEVFGIIFTPQLEFAIGDMLISLRKKK